MGVRRRKKGGRFLKVAYNYKLSEACILGIF